MSDGGKPLTAEQLSKLGRLTGDMFSATKQTSNTNITFNPAALAENKNKKGERLKT